MMGRRLFSIPQMQQAQVDATIVAAYGVTVQALVQFAQDLLSTQILVLKSPSADFQFVWDPKTGERFLFKGTVDPL